MGTHAKTRRPQVEKSKMNSLGLWVLERKIGKMNELKYRRFPLNY